MPLRVSKGDAQAPPAHLPSLIESGRGLGSAPPKMPSTDSPCRTLGSWCEHTSLHLRPIHGLVEASKHSAESQQ
eukprot:6172397-Pleurochrysis_carterae.AAC.4